MTIFVESIRRLYKEGKVDERKIIDLFNSGNITKDEKDYILDVQ